ncbi:type III secretion system export apparatus subunit SctS [Trinickia fusca]|uniref:EscS/YscS/HrcS family type III secretion system export apparatus protein n=1 Tax=Trinickia fusca TaxID=2419777 RepID=A0A494X8W1_9BURK|nr:type III secretion system export apparatus subunit SctS [Trinickia fusca]RKP46900.1 EscS/YscS/HrcS family type III secretion system export apparatus protein [Trinickia fusca]
MNPHTIAYFQNGLMLVVYLTAPPLVVALVAGLIVSLLQTVFQIQDQTLPFSVKLVAVGSTLALCGRWLGLEILNLATQAMNSIALIR